MSLAYDHPNDPANEDRPSLPANVQAEQALLGALLFDNRAFEAVADVVRAEHFHEPFHARLYETISTALRRGSLADAVVISQSFAADPAYRDLGGLAYLGGLIDQAPPTANAAEYGRIIADCAGRRALLALLRDIAVAAYDSAARPVHDVLADLERGAALIANETAVSESWTSAGDAVAQAIDSARTRSGTIDYPFGIASLDRFTGGMKAREVTLAAARPGMGKSVAALNVARANAAQGLGVCLFSLEMTRDAVALRLACDVAYDRRAIVFSGEPTCPTFERAMKGELSADQWARIEEAREVVRDWPLMIDDRAGLSMAQIEAAARRQHRRWARAGVRPGPVIIDHLGKVRTTRDRRGNRTLEVADVSADGANMAKALGVPVLALVQLNRGVEGRDDKRPVLSDLRQAGELEEDARQVMFLYRPEYYVREGSSGESFEDRAKRIEKLEACKNQMFWLVEKNSHGPRGQVQTFCEIACSAIRDREP